MKIFIDKIDAFFFDFDGVMTNNRVYLDQDGKEIVGCHRSDGLAFDVLRKLNKPSFIISTEKNRVVTMRANKLKIQAIQGVNDKVKAIKELSLNNKYKLENIFYVGNDLNDYQAMKICGFSACPADSHVKIKDLSDIILKTNGGEGVIRCLLEDVFEINILKILYEN